MLFTSVFSATLSRILTCSFQSLKLKTREAHHYVRHIPREYRICNNDRKKQHHLNRIVVKLTCILGRFSRIKWPLLLVGLECQKRCHLKRTSLRRRELLLFSPLWMKSKRNGLFRLSKRSLNLCLLYQWIIQSTMVIRLSNGEAEMRQQTTKRRSFSSFVLRFVNSTNSAMLLITIVFTICWYGSEWCVLDISPDPVL